MRTSIAMLLCCAWLGLSAAAGQAPSEASAPETVVTGEAAPVQAADSAPDPEAAVEPQAPAARPPESGEPLAMARAAESDGLEPEIYTYRSGTRRDPFAALVKAEPPQAGEDGNRRPGVSDIMITGIVWGGRGKLALAETFWGAGLLLHEGDKLRDGRVVRISPDGVTLRQTGFGVSRTITLTIGTGEETGNER